MPMKLAFCLFKYFPYGGLQRDFIRIAQICRQRGHDVHVYTMQWEGEIESEFKLHLIATKGWQNHTRSRHFANQVHNQLMNEKFDLVIGFNKMPYLDLYYAADVCYAARIQRERSFFYRLLPRYRQRRAFEQAVFAQGKTTDIMLISSQQQPEFVNFYQTEKERFHLLPPGIAKDRIAPANASIIRAQIRKANQISEEAILLLMVGSGFKTKGLDRAIFGLAAVSAKLKQPLHLLVIGQDNPTPFIKLARKLGVSHQLQFLGGRSDVAHFMLAADLLLHPAYHENTGTVLLEAAVAGLPVLTVSNCGYAHYIEQAKAGMVLKLPFAQAEFNETLQKMLLSKDRAAWQQNGLAFAKQADIYSLPEKAADLIEYAGQKRVFT